MNVYTGHELSIGRPLPDMVAEYEAKAAALPDALAAFERAGKELLAATTVRGTYGQESIDTGRVMESTLRANLLRSAWVSAWDWLSMEKIASADDKRRWKQSLTAPPPFTIDNLFATFGPYIENPRRHILRGLAEVFAGLDPAFKSHDKMKIGVKALPKRIILRHVTQPSIVGDGV